MGPRLEEAQKMNVQEIRRLMQRQVEPVKRVASMRCVWYALIIATVAAGAMDSCHRGHEAQAAWRRQPTADAVQLSGDYPVTRRDWSAMQEEAIAREYGKIAGER